MKKYISVLTMVAVLLGTVGCSSANTADLSSVAADVNTSSAVDVADGGSKTADSATDGHKTKGESVSTTAAYMPESGFAADLAPSVEGEGSFATEYPEVSADVMADVAMGDMVDIGGDAVIPDDYYIEEPAVKPQAGLLTGGEWNDNDNWHDWISLYQTHEDWNIYRDLWQVDIDVRHEVTVTAYGEPLEGAKVVQRDCGTNGVYSAVTDNEGKAYLFFPKCGDDMEHSIEVIYGEVRVLIENVDTTSSGSYTADLTEALGQNEIDSGRSLDLMLMVDTTGSMWDELEYIQAELEDVIKRVQSDNANVPVRVSVNFYRDEGDDYVIREFPFNDNIEAVLSDLRAQSADGGGDTPEAVHTALDSAVKGHEWRENSTKLMFFVLDAPPHEDAQIIDEVNNCIEIAAAKGVRVIPVASSGIDKATEYLLRTMAFRTGGTYTFLTDHSGIGGSHIEPTIGNYEVEKLNDMMVRIINDYLK